MVQTLAVLSTLCFVVWCDALRVQDFVEEARDDVSDAAQVEMQLQSQAESQALVPHDYWSYEKSDERCKAARRGRNVRRVVGAAVGAVIALPMAIISGLGYSVVYWAWYLNGKTTLMLVATGGSALAGAWASFMTARFGVGLAHWSTDMLAYLFGQDGHKPVCCCADDPNLPEGERMCGTVGTTLGRRAQCPEGFIREPDQCRTVEAELTYQYETVGGCQCKDHRTCAINKYDRGHAWCKVRSSWGCSAKRFKMNPFVHWDYCRIAAAAVPGTNLTVNTNIAQFVINQEKSWFRMDPSYAWRFGSYTDVSKALVIAKARVEGDWFKKSTCFPGEPEETLDGCAERCLEDGATVAPENGRPVNASLPCVAFAYNRHARLCVRLPSEAIGAEFKPFQRNPSLQGGEQDGWQNFKLAPTE